ncbi:MAG TPA: M48 family metallopeptidase [Candidatus Avalokitesvara rifleensis]|uniref:M48 family metallopeptidase n=1 Tax=Candidatus Avalokitesvara rifleensis TaxID=3367620 RepID=UPI0040272AF3
MTLTRKTFAPILPIIAAIALLVSPIGCVETQTGPQVTRGEIQQETQRLEVKKQQYDAKKRQAPFAGKSAAEQQAVVNGVGSRLLRQAEKPMEIKFSVQESKDVNAGATFGNIMVTTGMMNFVGSEDELAAVVGHEIAHLQKDHVTKSIMSNLPVAIGSAIAESLSPGSGKVVEIGGNVFAQKYSRDMEREADYFGIIYAHKAGFNASAGIEVWERFALELPQSQQANIFNSHPPSTERMIRARKIAEGLRGSK